MPTWTGVWAGERSRKIKEMLPARLMRNEGEEDVQRGAFLAWWRRKVVSYPSVDVK